MKTIIVNIATALLILNRVAAEETQTEPQPVSVTLSSVVANKYLFSASGLELSRDPVVQTDLYVNFRNGIYADLWASRSLKGKWDDGGLGNEIDYGIGWNGTIKGLTAHIGVTYFDEPKSFAFGAGDILYSHVRIGNDFKHLSLTLGYENLTPLPDSGFQGGNIVSLTASKTFPLWNDKVTLPASLSAVYDSGTAGSERGLFIKGTAGVNWNATKQLTVNLLSVSYFIREKSDAMFGTGVTWNF